MDQRTVLECTASRLLFIKLAMPWTTATKSGEMAPRVLEHGADPPEHRLEGAKILPDISSRHPPDARRKAI